MAQNHPTARPRLKLMRERAGLSQERAAELIDAHRSLIAKLERGEQDLSERHLRRLASIYNCDPWELLDGAPLLSEDEKMLWKSLMSVSQEQLRALTQLAATMASRSDQKDTSEPHL